MPVNKDPEIITDADLDEISNGIEVCVTELAEPVNEVDASGGIANIIKPAAVRSSNSYHEESLVTQNKVLNLSSLN